SGVPDYDVTDFLGATVEAVPSWYAASPDPNQCDEVATTGCIAEASAPVDATPVGSSPLLQGVSGIRNWHMFTYFTSLPSEAQELFRYSFTCTSAQPQACEAGTSYNNNVPSPLPVVALIPFGTAAFGNGAVLLTSDSDTFSDDALGNSSGNDTLAENFFNYVAGNLSQGFTPMTPTRILDTRNGIGAPTAKVAAASEVSVQVTGVAGIPNDATAVALNVTATNQEGAGFLTVYPNGRTRPNTSNLNIPPGLVDTANAVVVQIGDGGKVNIWNENNPTDIVVDVTGYWSPSGEGLVTATTPERILDTRNNIGTTGGALGEGETRTVQVHGEGGVPNDATAVILNVTATEGTRGGFLTVHDTATVPNASNVNFQANTNRPNLVFAVISSSGTVNVTNAFGQTHVIFDVMGYVTPSSGSVLSPVGPIRILDSRNGTGTTAGKVASNATIEMTVNGDTTAPEGASAVLINLTVDAPDAAGFLTAHPDASVPNASNVNFAPSQTVPNLVLARVGSDGNVRITNTSPGTSNIIADVFASFPSS
ncbi:MAG TPA: hypothetical protein VF183_16025, partial [Acidimicrobiales bacterium]